jgi:hypothetical protein
MDGNATAGTQTPLGCFELVLAAHSTNMAAAGVSKRAAGVLLEVFKGSSAVLGEGALWSRKGLLWWIDIKGDAPAPSFNVFNPRNQKNHRYYMPSRIGTVVPVAGQNVALVALEDGLHALDLDTNELTCVVPMHRGGEALRMNDGKCDPEGRFWVRGRVPVGCAGARAQCFW